MGTVGGFALVVMVVPTVGNQVFLRVVTATPTVMSRMTPAVTTVKKAAVGGKKSPANAGTKKVLPYYLSVAPYKWNNTSYCFFTANGGLFLRPTAAF